MTASRPPSEAEPRPPEVVGLADLVERIQAEEISRAPRPGRLRAADVLEVRP